MWIAQLLPDRQQDDDTTDTLHGDTASRVDHKENHAEQFGLAGQDRQKMMPGKQLLGGALLHLSDRCTKRSMSDVSAVFGSGLHEPSALGALLGMHRGHFDAL
jgi:hypothetical protein